MKKKNRVCDDTCENCVYIGEGDFICDEAQEIVISDWVSIYGKCIVEKEDKK